MIVLILPRLFVIMWLCRYSMRCKCRTAWTTSSVSVSFNVRRQNVQSSGFKLRRSFNHNSWHWGVPLLLRQLQFRSHHLPRSATQTFPVGRLPSVTQCLSCPTFASHNSILGNAQKCSCSIMMTTKDSLSHETCKRADTVFSNFTKPNFFQIAPLTFYIFDQFTSIHSFFHFFQILTLFMTCAAKRRSRLSDGLSSATRTRVFCSAEILRVLHCRSTSLTAISTRPLAM